MDALDKAVAHMGTVAALAAAVQVSQSAPSMWRARKSVPAQHCLAIERATGGLVTRADLRPDDYWTIWPDLPPPDMREARNAA